MLHLMSLLSAPSSRPTACSHRTLRVSTSLNSAAHPLSLSPSPSLVLSNFLHLPSSRLSLNEKSKKTLRFCIRWGEGGTCAWGTGELANGLPQEFSHCVWVARSHLSLQPFLFSSRTYTMLARTLDGRWELPLSGCQDGLPKPSGLLICSWRPGPRAEVSLVS